MGHIFAVVGSTYSWATPEYMLDHMTLDSIFTYYELAIEYEENKSNILVNRLSVGLMGAKEPPKKKKVNPNEKPNKEEFYKNSRTMNLKGQGVTT